MKNQHSDKDKFIESVEKYIKKKSWFLLSFLVFFSSIFIYLRYADNKYEIISTIKIADNDRDKSILKEMNMVNDFGLFKKNFNSVDDEVQVLKSKSLIYNVVSNLNLNVQYYIQGKIKSLEIYKNPPLTINFLSNDTIHRDVDTIITVHIDSKSEFTFKDTNQKHNFGDKISTSIGDVIFTPNFEQKEMQVGKDIKVKISNINTITDYYNSKIKITPAGLNSSVVKISLNDGLKEKGIDIINELTKEYNAYVIDNKNQVVKLTSDFINSRLQIISGELSEVDLTAETVKKDNRLTDLAGQSSIFLQSEREIESEQISTSTQLQLIDYMNEYLQENNSSSDLIPANMSFSDNSINELTKKHNDLVIQRDRILKSSSEINPVVINLNAQISSLKQSLISSLENSKSSSQIKLDALNKQNSRITSQIYSAPKKERQFRDLQRQQSIKESLYLYLLEKREESAITNGVTSPNAIIIDSAYAKHQPIWPKKEILYLAALVFSLLMPIIIIYFYNLMDTKIKDKNDLTKILSIPYIGDIPKGKASNPVINKIDYSPKAEAFRILRSNIDFMLNSNKNSSNTIFITSTTSQEGKSHTSINLACSLSYSEKKVLLIETDIRVPKILKYLNIKNSGKKGLSDYISDPELQSNDIIIKQENNKYLDIIPSGTIPPNPAELLMNKRVSLLFSEMKKQYDYIIVDTAAVGIVTDTLLISNNADMFIYVVSANNIVAKELQTAQTLYDEGRLKNMTVLLNGVVQNKGYGYGYGGNPKAKKKWYQFS